MLPLLYHLNSLVCRKTGTHQAAGCGHFSHNMHGVYPSLKFAQAVLGHRFHHLDNLGAAAVRQGRGRGGRSQPPPQSPGPPQSP